MKRKGLSKKIRFEVFKRDNFTCQYCGQTPPGVILNVDHVIAVANGGLNDQDNLVTSCFNCNIGKGATHLNSVSKSVAERAKEVQETEEQLRGFQAILQSKKERIEEECWQVVDIIDSEGRKGFNNHLFRSIKTFVERMGVHEVMDSMEYAVSKKFNQTKSIQFKYFCGVCWNKIRAKEESLNGTIQKH